MHERHALLRAHGWAENTHLALPDQEPPLSTELHGNEEAPPTAGLFRIG